MNPGPLAPYFPAVLDDLYSARILKLAANLPRAGRLAAPDATAERVSKLCGSKAIVDVVVRDGVVVDYAQDVKACALGQAVASIVGEHVIGTTVEELEAARDQLRAMLKDNGPAPTGRFADLALLAPVKGYPPRHASTLVALEAAAEAARTASGKATTRTSSGHSGEVEPGSPPGMPARKVKPVPGAKVRTTFAERAGDAA